MEEQQWKKMLDRAVECFSREVSKLPSGLQKNEYIELRRTFDELVSKTAQRNSEIDYGRYIEEKFGITEPPRFYSRGRR